MNIGIIGLGFMGAVHAAACVNLPDVSITAVCSRNARRLSGDFSDVGGNLGLQLPNVDLSGARKYSDWEALVADPKVDAVDICVPSDLHPRITIAALQSGKHVLCEKPMALTKEDCDAMLRAKSEAGRILMIGHVLRFWPAYEYLRQWVADRPRHSVQAATFTRVSAVPDWSSWLTDPERSGGALMDLLIHDLDQALLIFGKPTSVSAKRTGECDAVIATLQYAEGLRVVLEGGWMRPGTPFAMTYKAETRQESIELGPDSLVTTDSTGMQAAVALPDDDPYRSQLSYFLQCCSSEREPDRCLPQESADAVKLAALLQQSQTSGGKEIACAL